MAVDKPVEMEPMIEQHTEQRVDHKNASDPLPVTLVVPNPVGDTHLEGVLLLIPFILVIAAACNMF